jgi:hypothetical protein
MRACLDRFEDNKAVLVFEDGRESVVVPRGLLPADCREGDILAISCTVDRHETLKRRKEVEELQENA